MTKQPWTFLLYQLQVAAKNGVNETPKCISIKYSLKYCVCEAQCEIRVNHSLFVGMICLHTCLFTE